MKTFFYCIPYIFEKILSIKIMLCECFVSVMSLVLLRTNLWGSLKGNIKMEREREIFLSTMINFGTDTNFFSSISKTFSSDCYACFPKSNRYLTKKMSVAYIFNPFNDKWRLCSNFSGLKSYGLMAFSNSIQY